jgi:hypothetical protein
MCSLRLTRRFNSRRCAFPKRSHTSPDGGEALFAPLPPLGNGWLRFGSKSPDYRFDTVLDFVAPLAALVSLSTLAEGALAGCRKAAWAAANRAIGTRNGLQLT